MGAPDPLRDISALVSSETLLAIAQIAGVFVGFAGLVSALGGRGDEAGRARQLALLRGVVAAGLLVVVASLVPVGLAPYGLSEPAVWRASSLAFLALIWAVILGLGRSDYGFRAALRESPFVVVAFWFVLEPGIQLPLALAAFGVAPPLAPAFYLTGLILNLCQAALLFATLVGSDVLRGGR